MRAVPRAPASRARFSKRVAPPRAARLRAEAATGAKAGAPRNLASLRFVASLRRQALFR